MHWSKDDKTWLSYRISWKQKQYNGIWWGDLIMDRVVWKICLPQIVLRAWKCWIKSLRENTNWGNSVVKVHYAKKSIKSNSYLYINCYVNTANINLLCQHLSTYYMTVTTIIKTSTWQFITWQMQIWFCFLNDSAYYINNYINDCAYYIIVTYMTTTKMNGIEIIVL